MPREFLFQVNEASFYFQHSFLIFEQGALCIMPQRLMKSLELLSLSEEVESNRNTSCALLITTLITSSKNEQRHCCGALYLQELQIHIYIDGS